MLLQYSRANHDFSDLLKQVHKEAFKFIYDNVYEPSVIQDLKKLGGKNSYSSENTYCLIP